MEPVTLLRAIETKSARCAVVGVGFIGSTLIDALRAAGYEVDGYDRNPKAGAGHDASILAGADVVVVAVRAPIASDGSVDLEPLRSAAAAIRDHPRDERLVILASTVPPGTTRAFAGWIERSSRELFVAHAPERLAVGHDRRDLRRIPHLVGGLDATATSLAARLLSEICDTVVPVSRPEVSELSKLLENAFMTVGIGLVGEVARIAHALDVPAREVTEAAATKTAGYYPFHPGAGVGGHCLKNDLQMLRHTARQLGWQPPLLDATAEVTEIHPRLVVDRLTSLLPRVEGARILLVGMGFKVGTADTSASPAYDVVRLLRERGAEPVFLDSRIAAFDVDGRPVVRVSNADVTPGRYAAAVLLAGDPALPVDTLLAARCPVLDTGGGAILPGRADGFLKL